MKMEHYDLWFFDTKILFDTLLATFKQQFRRVPSLGKIKSWCFWLVVIKIYMKQNKNNTKLCIPLRTGGKKIN